MYSKTLPRHFANNYMQTSQDISGRHYAYTLTERDREGGRLGASVLLHVKAAGVCTLVTIIRKGLECRAVYITFSFWGSNVIS